MNLIKYAALWLWQLPQNLLGLALWGIFRLQKRVESDSETDYNPNIIVWTTHPVFGVSLGKYIFAGKQATPTTIAHESGHSIQSRRFGPLYLFAVGIPSVIRNIRLPRQPGDWEARQRWYYSGWPEKQADALGGIKRTFTNA